MKHTFRGRVFKIKRGRTPKKCVGYTNYSDREIRFKRKQHGRKKFDTYIHEALHACFWELNEWSVAEAAKDISKFLWRLGYREKQ